MDYTALVKMAQDGGIVGLILAGIAIVTVWGMSAFFKNRAIVNIGEKDKIVDAKQIADIQQKLSSIDQKVGMLEREVHDRATREEVHALDKSITRLEGRFDTMQATAQSTAHAVSRIEEFMYAAALRSKV